MFRLRRTATSASGTQAADEPRPVLEPPPPPRHSDGVSVPYPLRFGAAWSWRLLLVVAAIYVVLKLFELLSVVLVPVIIGVLLAAVASPAADALAARKVPRLLAAGLVVVAGLAAIGGLIALVAQQFTSGFDDLRSSFESSLEKLEQWLVDLGLSRTQLQDAFGQVRDLVGEAGGSSLSGAVVQATVTAGHLVAGLLIAIFATFFLTYDGRRIWAWVVRLFPESAHDRVNGSGERAWAVLTAYVRATFVIALADALGIVLVAYLLGLPLLMPIGVLVFLGAFVPVVGATISGIAAVAVALVFEGPFAAVLMLAGVIGVQQLEGNVLQPLLMGRLVNVHPLAVVVVISIGALVAGVFGALIAVPLTAIINSVSTYLHQQRRSRLAAT